MRAGASVKFFAGCSLLSLGAQAQRWPIKTIDLSDDGALCDDSTEQYLQVEGYDFHDHPKFTMRWRQMTGPCGEELDEDELLSWETFYDSTDGDDGPNSDFGRVQLNLFLCCPFGDYEIDLIVESYSDEGSELQQRTAWEIENGSDEYHIWDTVNTYLADEEEYSPTVPGTYTWPLAGETGYYSTIYAGPLPPLECSSSVPSGTEYLGCFEDSNTNRLINSDFLSLEEMGADGMTNQVCSDYCADYDFFGLESGSQCFCGNAEDLEDAVESDGCGTEYDYLCTGDSRVACGGNNAISVYERTGAAGPSPTPSPVSPTPAPVETSPSPTPSPVSPTPAPVEDIPDPVDPTPAPIVVIPAPVGPTPTPIYQIPDDSADPTPSPIAPATPTSDSYSIIGCFADSKSNRVMTRFATTLAMNAEVCFGLCNDGDNTHFSTQYASECWCAEDPDLTKNGEELDLDDCDFECTGTTTGEMCGGRDMLTAYLIGESSDDDPVPESTPQPTPAPSEEEEEEEETPTEGGEYIGCYEDSKTTRALNDEGKNLFGDMTNEACIEFCADNGHPFAGTQYSTECWCGVTYDLIGEASDPDDRCDFDCEGDSSQICGGRDALSVWTTGV